MLTNAKHTLAHVTYTPLVLTYADRTCALANLDILEMDAIVQRQVLLIVSKTYKRVFCLIQTCMALGHDRTDNACTVSTSRCSIQSLRKVF